MTFGNNTILTKLPFWKHKTGFIFIGIIILVVLISINGIFLLSPNSTAKIISGKIYVDGAIASSGLDVRIIFPSGESIDFDGTDDQGCYTIDVSDYVNESGTFSIIYNGSTFIPSDKYGNSVNVVISDDVFSYPIDLFIFTTEEDSSGNDGSSDDAGEDQNDSDNANDNSSDTNDDSSSDETDEENDGGTDDSDSSDNSGDSDDDSSDDDSNNSNDGNDDSDDGSSDSQNTSCVKVEMLIWNDGQDALVDGVTVNVSEIVRFNVSVEYNGSFTVSDVNVLDMLPEGLEYVCNATIDGVSNEPVVDEVNHSLLWNVSSLTSNQTMFIEFNCSVTKKGNHTNLINVTCEENTIRPLTGEDTAYVEVYGNLIVEKLVWSDDLGVWAHSTVVNVSEIVRFNVSVEYNGSFTVSDVNVLDMLPEGLEYAGNATIDGVSNEPVVDKVNHSLLWKVSMLSSSQTRFIEFDVNVTDNATYVNSVQVSAKESIGQNFNKTSRALVTGKGAEMLICRKKVKIANGSWLDQIDVYVGDVVSFNITISNVGNGTIYNLYIFDKLPRSLIYVENSSMILFNNDTFQDEPDKDAENNILLWANINQIIQDYLSPQENLSIVFNVTVNKEGLAVNTVNISSTLCDGCTPLADSDTAIINATIPTPKLVVNTGGPYYGLPGDTITFMAIATGGILPYTFKWDLDNDSRFDDGNESTVSKQWTKEGNYTIGVQVTDNESTIATNITFVNISIPPLMVDAGDPYEALVGEIVTFNGAATGGVTNYTWHWEFGDENTSTFQHPSHTYMNAGTYIASLTVIDGENNSKNDTAQVIIIERDTAPPMVELTKPIDALYLKNRAVFPFFTSLIFGDIEICPTAIDNESVVERMELYINEDIVYTFYSSSGNWTWNKLAFGRQLIKIIAYDSAGNSNTIEQVVWKFF